MNWLALIALSPVLLWLAYIPAIQFKRGGWWRLMYPFTFVVGLFDVLLNYTVLAFYTRDWPKKGETTFSKRLRRLVQRPGLEGKVYVFIARKCLDPFDPEGRHV